MSTFRDRAHFCFFFLALLPILLSCDRNRVFEENIPIPEGTWKSRSKLVFSVEIPSQTQHYNVLLNIRNTPDYKFSNLFLFLTTHYPDSTTSKDTIELRLADYDGRWLGEGMGSVKFSRFLLKRNVIFPKSGNYRFEIEQAMRENNLKGICDAGIRIERPF
jgi:gliding motility-associated lipoprotein GldH